MTSEGYAILTFGLIFGFALGFIVTAIVAACIQCKLRARLRIANALLLDIHDDLESGRLVDGRFEND